MAKVRTRPQPEGSSPATSPPPSGRPGRPRKSPISSGSLSQETPGSAATTDELILFTCPEAQRQRKKRCKNSPGTAALREIRHIQKSVKLVIPSAPFIRCVREITSTMSDTVTKWEAEAIQCIHEAAEDFLVHLFKGSTRSILKRVTLK